MYKAYITRIKNLHKHPNADRLQVGECFGNQVVVSLEYTDNQLGIYFPSDGRLSVEFAEKNNLLRKKDENGNNIGGYMEPDKRRITAIKLRGEKSDGLFLPLSSLESFGNINKLSEGDTIDTFNNHLICEKYIPYRRHASVAGGAGKRVKRRARRTICPTFFEHKDTEQLAYNLSAFKPGDQIEITLKMHGTSQRIGYLPVVKKYKRTIIDRIMHREGKPIYNYEIVAGTRRVVLENYENGYYGSDKFREPYAKLFEGKLHKNETVYAEIVGFVDENTPIMASGNNKKLNDKEIIKQYGEVTEFSYGCAPVPIPAIVNASTGEESPAIPQNDIYVYRMTMTNEDGDVVEYSPDFMRYRCEQMGVKTVPVLWKGIIPENLQTENFLTNDNGDFDDWIYAENAGEWIRNKAEQYYDGPDPIGKTHIREGVVVRVVNRPNFTAYKHKNHTFKMITGIISEQMAEKDTANISEDMLSEM